MALHPHRAVGRKQDRAGSIALAGVQSGLLQPSLDRIRRRQAPSGVQSSVRIPAMMSRSALPAPGR